ncbi:MAG: hypothetical protein HY828_06245 [Actinobacteria bacterium]|nr:hypothetical protein [Actinomycetota bacterium]
MEDANAVDVTMQMAVLIVVAVSSAVTIVTIRYTDRRIRQAELHPAVRTTGERDRVLLAGIEGPHLPRLHGPGVLAVFDDRVTFVSASVPHRVVTIPRAHITTVDLTSALRIRGHWRRNRRHWLRIRWQTGIGLATIGIVVPNPASWANILKPQPGTPQPGDA